MRDFSAPHRRKVPYFGIWTEDGRDEQLGDIDAWNILCDAVRRCTTEDMRVVNPHFFSPKFIILGGGWGGMNAGPGANATPPSFMRVSGAGGL